MKKLFFLFALIMSTSIFAQTNLVTNGDFSDGLTGWTIDFQKAKDSSIYVITIDNALLISQPEDANGRIDIWQDVPVEGNTEYEFSFDYKENYKKLRIWSFLVSENDVWIYFNDTTNKDPFRTYNSYFDTTTVYKKLSYKFKTPDTDTIVAFKIQYRLYKQTGNLAAIRNIKVVKTDILTDLNSKKDMQCIGERYFLIEKQMIIIRKNGHDYDMFGNIVK